MPGFPLILTIARDIGAFENALTWAMAERVKRGEKTSWLSQRIKGWPLTENN
jgi:hypothetical protein